MRILLVNPSRLDGQQGVIKYRRGFLPPLSLALLDALTPDCHSVRVVNDIAENLNFDDEYDLVAISAMTTQAGRAYQIADAFRARGSKVVIGGMHATVLPSEVKEHANAVVIGEAENVWGQVLDDCQQHALREFYRDPDLPDLQEQVAPRWDHMNMNVYPRRPGTRLPIMPVFTTRGCPLGCKFCSVTKFFGRSYRMRPVSHVIQDLDAVDTKDYFFVDDNIACAPDYSRDLFKALEKKNIHWFGQISTTVLRNPDLLDLAARSGCSYLFVGVESLSRANLDTANKRFNKVEQYSELIQRMKRAGIVPFLSFIFGFDEDTPEQFQLTLDFLRRNRVGFASFHILTPLPGTDMYADGRIEIRNWSFYDTAHPVFRPKNFSTEQLVDCYWRAYQKLYSHLNIARNVYYNVRSSRSPVSELLRSRFYQIYYRAKVYSCDHPFSGGIGLVQQ